MKIFVITSQIPFPWWFYGRSSFYFLIKNLVNRGIQVYLSFPINSIQENEENIKHLENLGIKVYPFEHDTRDKISFILKNLFEKEPFKIKKYWNENYFNFLSKVVESIKPDIVQVHTSHMFKYGLLLKKKFEIPVILRQQDIVHNQVLSFLKEVNNPLYKLIALWQYYKTVNYEKKIWRYADKIVFITKSDYDYAIKRFKVSIEKATYVYDGIPTKDNLYIKNKEKIKAFAFAASDQLPNIISLRWFINIWKNIADKTDFEFHIFGKVCNHFSMKENELRKYKIILKGFIQNPNDLHNILSKYIAFISPTIQGSGYRTKIFEVMSIGLLVICTEFDYKPIAPIFKKNEDLFVFSNEIELLKIIEELKSNMEVLLELSDRVHKKIEYNYEIFTDEFIKIYNEILSKKG